MNKKTCLTLLLAATLVAFGGFLPKLSAMALDHIDSGKPVYQNISPIQLDTAGPAWQSLSLTEKLSLLRDGGQMVHVSPGIMRSAEEDIWDSCLEELAVYQEAGLLPEDVTCLDQILMPCLIFDSAGSDRCDLFWEIHASFGDTLRGMDVVCLMDDETGRLLQLVYAGFRGEPLYASGSGRLEQLGRLYFEQLGLEPVIMDNAGDFLSCLLSDPSEETKTREGSTIRIDLISRGDAVQMHLY